MFVLPFKRLGASLCAHLLGGPGFAQAPAQASGQAAAQARQDRKGGLVWNRDLSVADGAEQLRIVLRDVSSGSIGSVNIPLRKLFSSLGS